MAADRSYVAQNNAQRERLRALVARLKDEDLRRPLPAGWTVAGVLAHLAFWDQRILVLIERWERSGPDLAPHPLNRSESIGSTTPPRPSAWPCRRPPRPSSR